MLLLATAPLLEGLQTATNHKGQRHEYRILVPLQTAILKSPARVEWLNLNVMDAH